MANVRVAINGFGRIGRLAFRQMFGAEGYEIVAINDLTSPKMLAHLLKYDSAQGRYALADTVSADDEAGTITVNGKTIRIYAEKDAANCPPRRNPKRTSRRAPRKSSFPLLRATTFPPSFTASTKRPLPPTIRSFPRLPAPPTASLPWRTPSTSSRRSRRAI